MSGFEPDEIEYLALLGYGRWLERGRLTAEMVVALIDDALVYLAAIAEDRARHPAVERRHMIIVLSAMTATSHRDDENALRLLDALVRLDVHVTKSRGPRYKVDKSGRLMPAAEPRRIAAAWSAIQEAREFEPLITRLRNQIANELSSKRELELGGGRSVTLGERPRHLQILDQLQRELGRRYLAPNASLAYRCERVRKWKQLALDHRPPRLVKMWRDVE